MCCFEIKVLLCLQKVRSRLNTEPRVQCVSVCMCILGVPDSPSQCLPRHIDNTTAVIFCYPGYNGGQQVSYVVYKAGILHHV